VVGIKEKQNKTSFLKSNCEKCMLIRAFIIKSSITPTRYPSRPLRVERNREIINIMMLPAQMTEISQGLRRKPFEYILLDIFYNKY